MSDSIFFILFYLHFFQLIYLFCCRRAARLPQTPTQRSGVGVGGGVGYVNNVGIAANDQISGLAPQLADATSVLESLSDREKQIILDVLKRDEEVRLRDAARIR